MGCSASSNVVGNVVVTLTPADNLEVGSIEFLHDLELTEAMFKKSPSKTNGKANEIEVEIENKSAEIPTWRLCLPQLNGAIKQLSIAFTFPNAYNVEKGKIEFSLVRNDEVVHTKELFEGSPMQLTSVTYGYKIANPLVNLSQPGDCYQIRIFLY